MMIALLSFHSCRQDLLPDKETYNNSSAFQLTSKRISLNESKHKSKLLPELEKAKAEFKELKIDALGKTVSYGNGVSIDTDNVTYIENGPNYHTYTFTITRENAPAEAPLENLVLSPTTDGTYKELLVTYNLTPLEKEQLQNGIPVDLKTKAIFTKLGSGTYSPGLFSKEMVCHTELHETFTTCSANEHNHGEQAYSEDNPGGCKATTISVKVIVAIEVCNYSGGGSMGEPGSPPGTGEGGGGGGGGIDPNNEPCNGNGVLTEPQQPNLTDPNRCTGIPTMPTLPGLEDMAPCEILKRNSNNTKFQVKLDSIKQRVLSTKP